MLEYIYEHIDCKIILVEKTDRLTRNMTDFLRLDIEKTDLEVHFVRENKILNKHSSPAEFFIQDIQVAQAAYISRNISAESRKGMKEKAEQGLYPSYAPLGYVNAHNEQGVKIIEPDPEVAPLIQIAFEQYSTGDISLKALAEDLYNRCLRTKHGRRVSTSTMYKLLHNPLYMGSFVWNGIEYSGKHDSIVTSELWYAVQDVFKHRSNAKQKKTAIEFTYRGLMQCDICGCSITAERKKNKYTYYHCTWYKGKHDAPSVREEKLDKQFSELLWNLKINKEVIDWILCILEADTESTRKSLKETLNRLQDARKRLLNRREILYDDRLDGRISIEKFDEKDSQCKKEIERLNSQINNIESNEFKDILASTKSILELSHNAHNLFLTAPAVEKRELLRNLLSNCTLSNGIINPTLAEPFNRLLFTNIIWKRKKAENNDFSDLRSVWYPERDSNSRLSSEDFISN
jgi:DNA invertase Pin-like site-specific DNA recombinase